MSKRVLIVDDDADFAAALATRCRSIGLQVETANNPLTAMSIIGVRPPDVICLDVEMPTGNGLSVRELLAVDPVACKTPVIIVTGRKDQGTIHRCGEWRAYYVYKSPNVWQSLRPVLCELLDYTPSEATLV